MAETVPPTLDPLQEPRQPLAQKRALSCDTTSLRTQQPPPYGPPPMPPPPPPHAMIPGSSAKSSWPPLPPPVHWHRLVHKPQCRHTDEEEGHPQLGGRIPEPGLAETGGRQAHQRQGPPPAVPQPSSLTHMTQQPPTAPQGQDKPVRSQEHDHPALTAAPLRSRPAKSRP